MGVRVRTYERGEGFVCVQGTAKSRKTRIRCKRTQKLYEHRSVREHWRLLG